MKTISYYELLKMIKDGNIPKKVNYKITGYLENYVEYTAQYDGNDFTHYELTNRHREDENIHFYLNGNYLESDMFDENILIIEEKRILEKLDIRQEKNIKNNWKWKVYGKEHSYNISTPQKIIADKVNDICDYLNSKGE